MALRAFLGRLRGSQVGASVGEGGQAVRASELNEAISRLWQADGTHTKASFRVAIVPIYTALLEELQTTIPTDLAEARVIELLKETTAACTYRWSLRLPMKRPGSDYRKYEIIYTYALVTAMAVGSLQKCAGTDSIEDLAARILMKEGMARLRADPIVWEDWLGYFAQSDVGGLYAVSVRGKIHQPMTGENPVEEGEGHTSAKDAAQCEQPPAARDSRTRAEPEQQHSPPAGSGRAMLAAIREAIADGSLSVNQPSDAIQVDREGRTFLEYPAILEWCIEHLALDDDLKRIKNRFNRLKVYKRTPEGKQLFRGKLRARDPRARGYVLEDASVLWSETPPAGRFVIENLTALE